MEAPHNGEEDEGERIYEKGLRYDKITSIGGAPPTNFIILIDFLTILHNNIYYNIKTRFNQ